MNKGGAHEEHAQAGERSSTWQEMLGRLIENPQERERLAEAARVRAITLQRWASKVSKPRPENMRMLLNKLTLENYALFARLISVDFPDLVQENAGVEQARPDLPAEFYARVLEALAFTPLPIGRQTVQDLIFRQALEQLDPERLGLSISLVCCIPPGRGQKVRSLRDTGGIGTSPWKHDLGQKTMLLGAESLVGHILPRFHYGVINSRSEMTFFPANWTEHEQSVAAFSISRQAKLAGGLLISSAHEYFFTDARIALLERYAHLASLIFEPEEFFDVKDINLGMLPSEERQAPYFQNFNQRVAQKFSIATATHMHLSLQKAHLLVWQDLEEELLQAFLQPDHSE